MRTAKTAAAFAIIITVLVMSYALASILTLDSIAVAQDVTLYTLIIREKLLFESAASLDISPDGNKIALGLGWKTPGIMIVDLYGNELLYVEIHKPGEYGAVNSISWSPDSKYVAAGVLFSYTPGELRGMLLIISAETGEVLVNITSYSEEFLGVDWSPDGDIIAVLASGTRDVIYAYSPRGELLWTSPIYGRAEGVAWSPDGSRVAVGTMLHILVFGRDGTLKGMTPQSYVEFPYEPVAWSPDGKLIAGGAERTLAVVDAETLELLWSYKFDERPEYVGNETRVLIKDLAWSHDSELLAVLVSLYTPYSSQHELFFFTSNGKLVWSSDLFSIWAESIDWSDNGEFLAYTAGSTLRLLSPVPIYRLIANDPAFNLATLELVGPPGVVVVIKGGEDNLIEESISDRGTAELILPAGTYTVEFRYVPEALGVVVAGISADYISSGEYTVELKRGEKAQIEAPGIEDILGTIIIEGIADTEVSLSWQTGETRLRIPPQGELMVYASPGIYNLTAWLPMPGSPPLPHFQDTLGQVTITGIVVESDTKKSIDLKPYTPGTLEVSNPNPKPVDVNLTWTINGGTEYHAFTLEPFRSSSYAVLPGEYDIEYEVKWGEHYYLLGNVLSIFKGVLTARVAPGNATLAQIPDVTKLLGRLVVEAQSTAEYNITWPGGYHNGTLVNGGRVEYLAVPGYYTVYYELEQPNSGVIVGDVSDALKGFIQVKVDKRGIARASIPTIEDLLGLLRIESSYEGIVLVRGMGSNATFEVTPDDTIIILVAPGDYTIDFYYAGHRVFSTQTILSPGQKRTVLIEVPDAIIKSLKTQTQATTTTTTPQEQTITQSPPPSQAPPSEPITTSTPETTTGMSEATQAPQANIVTGTQSPDTSITSTQEIQTMQAINEQLNTTTPTPQTHSQTSAGNNISKANNIPEGGFPEETTPSSLTISTHNDIRVESTNSVTQIMSLLLPGAISVLIIITLLTRRKEGTKPEQLDTLKAEKKFDLASLLGKPIHGFYTGPSCTDYFNTTMPKYVIGDKFSGEWKCCEIGCGGWGCAFQCKRHGNSHDSGSSVVVFKVPKQYVSLLKSGSALTVSEYMLRKIVNEANTLRNIKHPHVLKLLGYSDSAPILIYEYADGGTLEYQQSMGWKPSVADSLLIGIQLADALRYLHSRGLVHGDIKPNNVFIASNIVKLGDFSSMIKLLAITTRQSLSITPGWRAPEQVYSDLRRKAEEHGLENRIDIYQLGNLLLFLITGSSMDGEDAIRSSSREEVLQHLLSEDVPRELVNIISDMMLPDAVDRPSADEVVRRLLDVYNKVVGKNNE